MTVEELVQELMRLDQPGLPVHVPCPHCCGQQDTDFDLLHPEYISQVEHNGRPVVLLGDPGQSCLNDLRSRSRSRVRQAAVASAPAIAAGLGLDYVRRLDRTDIERMYRDTGRGQRIFGTGFGRLLRSLVLEATEGQNTHYVMVETPYRAMPEDVGVVMRAVELMTELSGRPCHAVVACVVRDPSTGVNDPSGGVHWHLIRPEELVEYGEWEH